jgi:nucleoside-diphosphate-sugar epimerase
MKVLITGGLGLIGHNVAARLQQREDTVYRYS